MQQDLVDGRGLGLAGRLTWKPALAQLAPGRWRRNWPWYPRLRACWDLGATSGWDCVRPAVVSDGVGAVGSLHALWRV